MKNKLSNLNDHLFAEIERLSDEDLKEEKLKEEIDRAKAITIVSGQIIDGAKLALEAQKSLTSCLIEETPNVFKIEGGK